MRVRLELRQLCCRALYTRPAPRGARKSGGSNRLFPEMNAPDALGARHDAMTACRLHSAQRPKTCSADGAFGRVTAWTDKKLSSPAAFAAFLLPLAVFICQELAVREHLWTRVGTLYTDALRPTTTALTATQQAFAVRTRSRGAW